MKIQNTETGNLKPEKRNPLWTMQGTLHAFISSSFNFDRQAIASHPLRQISGVRFQPSGFQKGFSLVEVTLALGVAVFCLTTIFGLLPVGINSNMASVDQTVASGMISAITADLRATPLTSGTTANYKIHIPGTTTQQLRLCADGTVDSSGGANSIYLAYVTFSGTTSSPSATPVRILITWPAAGDLNNNPPKNFAGSYEAVTTLNRY